MNSSDLSPAISGITEPHEIAILRDGLARLEHAISDPSKRRRIKKISAKRAIQPNAKAKAPRTAIDLVGLSNSPSLDLITTYVKRLYRLRKSSCDAADDSWQRRADPVLAGLIWIATRKDKLPAFLAHDLETTVVRFRNNADIPAHIRQMFIDLTRRADSERASILAEIRFTIERESILRPLFETNTTE